jgi:hypothetical protein
LVMASAIGISTVMGSGFSSDGVDSLDGSPKKIQVPTVMGSGGSSDGGRSADGPGNRSPLFHSYDGSGSPKENTSLEGEIVERNLIFSPPGKGSEETKSNPEEKALEEQKIVVKKNWQKFFENLPGLRKNKIPNEGEIIPQRPSCLKSLGTWCWDHKYPLVAVGAGAMSAYYFGIPDSTSLPKMVGYLADLGEYLVDLGGEVAQSLGGYGPEAVVNRRNEGMAAAVVKKFQGVAMKEDLLGLENKITDYVRGGLLSLAGNVKNLADNVKNLTLLIANSTISSTLVSEKVSDAMDRIFKKLGVMDAGLSEILFQRK